MPLHPRHSSAFSLVELSIVLVILGLLTGGILAGQSLVRAAELNSVISEFQRYQTAIQTFKEKYFALPGDMNNATAFWGYTGGAGCTNSSGTAVSSPGTCDGDGDGIIIYGAVAGQSGEAFQGWRHMALAGLIAGNYSGIDGGSLAYTDRADHNFGSNSPASKISKAGWGLTYLDNLVTGNSYVYKYNYRNWLTIGGDDQTFADAAFLKAEEAWNIDTKIDDGLPGGGKVNTWPNCSMGNSWINFTSNYNVSNSDVACPLLLKP